MKIGFIWCGEDWTIKPTYPQQWLMRVLIIWYLLFVSVVFRYIKIFCECNLGIYCKVLLLLIRTVYYVYNGFVLIPNVRDSDPSRVSCTVVSGGQLPLDIWPRTAGGEGEGVRTGWQVPRRQIHANRNSQYLMCYTTANIHLITIIENKNNRKLVVGNDMIHWRILETMETRNLTYIVSYNKKLMKISGPEISLKSSFCVSEYSLVFKTTGMLPSFNFFKEKISLKICEDCPTTSKINRKIFLFNSYKDHHAHP